MAKISIHEKGEYLSDIVFAASDGMVTTFAIVAGSAGASLDNKIVLILGFANLFADGFSMASGSYLGVKSEIEYEEAKGKSGKDEGAPLNHSIVTFIAFVFVGIVPLIPFLSGSASPFKTSLLMVGVALFVVGFLRSIYTKKNMVKSGIEMFAVGGFAAFVAYAIGYLIERFVV